MKLKGLTAYAERQLDVEDFEDLERMIGCEVTYCTNKAIVRGKMYILIDGQEWHEDFLIIE